MIKLLKLAAMAAMALILTGCGVVKGSSNSIADTGIKIVDKFYVHDNRIEEMIEDKIEDVTSISVDLTPTSPEDVPE